MTQLSYSPQPVMAIGGWTENNTFEFVMRAIEEPHATKVELNFIDEDIIFLSHYLISFSIEVGCNIIH